MACRRSAAALAVLVCLAGCTGGGSSLPRGHHARSQPRLIHVGNSPVAIAITPDGRTAYVASDLAATGPGGYAPRPGKVTPIDLATGTAGKPIQVGLLPDAIAITRGGRTAYVANFAGNTVTPISLASGTPGPAIQVGNGPEGIAITPDGRTAYVANKGLNAGGIGHTVTPISVATGTPGPAIQVGDGPVAIAITPDGRTAYVANYGTNGIGHTVTPISVATGTPGPAIQVGEGPFAITITPGGRAAYVVTNARNTVTPIKIK